MARHYREVWFSFPHGNTVGSCGSLYHFGTGNEVGSLVYLGTILFFGSISLYVTVVVRDSLVAHGAVKILIHSGCTLLSCDLDHSAHRALSEALLRSVSLELFTDLAHSFSLRLSMTFIQS